VKLGFGTSLNGTSVDFRMVIPKSWF